MILVATAIVILVPLAYVAGMAWVVTGFPHKLSFWYMFVTFVFLIASTVGLFTSLIWLMMLIGWTK